MTAIRMRTMLIGAGALLALAMPASVSAQGHEIVIYDGQPAAQSGISLLSWGSGEAKDSGDYVFTGGKSIRIVTHGLFQGVRLVLAKPLDLKASDESKSAFLQMVLHLPANEGNTYSTGSTSPYGGTGPRGGSGALGGSRGAFGGSGDSSNRMIKVKPLENIRVVLVTSDNQRIEERLAVDGANPLNDDWSSLAIPISAIAGLKDTDEQLKEIRIFGDNPAVIYLGELRIIRDDTPIRVDDLEERIVARNDSVSFTASAEAGPTPLKYEWTFITVKVGVNTVTTGDLPVDAVGKTVKHEFRKSGDYVVVLTVRDQFGLKHYARTKTNVHVTL